MTRPSSSSFSTVLPLLGWLTATLAPALCSAQSPPTDPVAYIEQVRTHTGPGQGWVQCQGATKRAATDALGPVISHGFTEAPGYYPGLLDEGQARFLRRAIMHRLPISPGFLLEDTVLPSPTASDREVTHFIEGAILTAGFSVPGDAMVIRSYDIPHRGDVPTPQLDWDVQFFHDGVLISGGLCRLQAASRGPEANGALACWLPDAPLRTFELFTKSTAALQSRAIRAASGLGFRGGRVLTKSRYDVSAGTGLARTNAVLYDGNEEYVVDMDGQGNILSSHVSGRTFRFQGYSLDYKEGLHGVDSEFPLGISQLEYLDSADRVTGDNCVSPSPDPNAPVAGAYPNGFVVCRNDVLAGNGFTNYSRTKPRVDDDYTNAANATPPTGYPVDPIGVQQTLTLALNGNSSVQVPYRPLVSGTVLDSWRGSTAATQFVAGAGQADLQLFQSVGFRHRRLYLNMAHLGYATKNGVANPDFVAQQVNGPKYRTELGVHLGGIESTKGALSYLHLGDLIPEPAHADITAVASDKALEVVADGSIVSHEYHHHIQYELEYEYTGKISPPSPLNEGPDDKETVAEGMADLYGAMATGRNWLGQLVNPADTSDPCAFPDQYPYVADRALRRPVCNKTVLHNPHRPNISEPAPQDAHTLGGALSGAGYRYATRIRSEGATELLSMLDLYQAEMIYWSTLGVFNSHNNVKGSDPRRILEGLIIGLHFNSPLTVNLESPGDPNAPGTLLRRTQAALSSFGSKGINLDPYTAFTCNSGLCPTWEKAVAQATRVIALTAPARISPNEEATSPTFDVLTVTGDAYQANANGDNVVTLEVSLDPLFGPTPQGFTLTVPPAVYESGLNKFGPNNSPVGFFTATIPSMQWGTLRDNAKQTANKRLYYRLKVCSAVDVTKCAYTTDPNNPDITSTFMVFSNATGDGDNCAFSPSRSENTGRASWALGLLALTALGLRRRGQA